MSYIKVGFSHSKYPNWITKFQMWYFNIEYSHTYIRFLINRPYRYDLDLVLHATGMGLHVVSYNSFLAKRSPVEEFLVSTNSKTFDDFVQDAFNTTGKPYGTKQMMGAGLAKIFKLKKNPFGNVNETFCSKAVGNKLKKFLYFDIPGDPNLWVPKDIYDYMKKRE